LKDEGRGNRDRDRIRGAASEALAAVGQKYPEPVIRFLKEAIEDEKVVLGAIYLLSKVGVKHKEATVVLLATLKDKREVEHPPGTMYKFKVADKAMGSLSDIGQAAVPLLVDALADADSEVRWRAAKALGRIVQRGEARDALPTLRRANKDADAKVREEANWALEQQAAFEKK